jgi:hypothetical protein
MGAMIRTGDYVRRAFPQQTLLALACVASIACSSGSAKQAKNNAASGGSAAMSGGGSGSGQTSPDSSVPVDCQSDNTYAGPSPLRRLTRDEYNNTVHSLLGDSTQPAKSFPEEELTLGFPNIATAQSVSVLLIEQYESAASKLAAAAVTDVKAFMGCDASGSSQKECATSFVKSFGLKAYRRPLSDDEVGRLVTFFQSSATSYDVATAAKLTVQAMLQTASFLYRVEPSDQSKPGRVHRLSGYEIATRLSYLIWGSMPDKALFDAAASGALDDNAEVRKQAQRLLAAPEAKGQVATFFEHWLDLNKIAVVDKDASTFPDLTPAVRGLLRQQDDAFLQDVAFSGGKLDALLQGTYTYLNKDLAAYYGVPGPSGATFEKVNWPDDKRRGFLGLAGFLASSAKSDQTSPVQRGLFVRERFFCTTPPPPPPTVNTSIPPKTKDQTTRERFAQHEKDASCAGCHKMMDPIGLGLEHFDGGGRWRDQEDGNTIDDSGELINADVSGTFNGLGELADKLVASQDVKNCVVKQWFRFGYGRKEESVDQCSLDDLGKAFADSDGDFPALVLALTQTDAFLNRTEEGANP